MSDEIAKEHAKHLKEGIFHKSHFMKWRKQPYAMALKASGLPLTNHDLRPDRWRLPASAGRRPIWLKGGNYVHDFADKLHDLIKPKADQLAMLYHRDDIIQFMSNLVTWSQVPKFLWNSLTNIITFEADRWVECMRHYAGNTDKVLEYFLVPYRELKLTVPEKHMALNVDRMEYIPGRPGEIRLMELKKKVSDDIRQELAWYHYGLEKWLEERDLRITEWYALGYDMLQSSVQVPEKRFGISLKHFQKSHARFNREMLAIVNARDSPNELAELLQKARENRIIKKARAFCAHCEYSYHCFSDLHFELPTNDDEPWEVERQKRSQSKFNPYKQPDTTNMLDVIQNAREKASNT